MLKYKLPVLPVLIILLFVSCTITPEETEEKELSPVVSEIQSPVISDITVVNDEENPSITVRWEPVDNATYYVFEYESATDYLSGEKDFISRTVHSNSFKIDSTLFTNTSDMRYVFRVKAAYKPSSSRSTIYSKDSEIREAVVVNTFSMSPIIQDNELRVYSSFPKIKSVLKSGNITDPAVRYYSIEDGEAVLLDSNVLTLSSAETKTIRGELVVDGKTVALKEVTVKNSADYYPSHLISLKAGTNEEESISLTWSAPPVNNGLEDNNPEVRFYIERKEEDKDGWLTLSSDYIEGETEGGTYTFSDTTPESGKDYIYRVITQYILIVDGSAVTFDEKKENALESNVAFIRDREVRSFILTPKVGFDGEPAEGKADYIVYLEWEPYHEMSDDMEYLVTRWDFDSITFVDGTPTDENSGSTKYEVIYRGTNTEYLDSFTLTKDENTHARSYTYFIQLIKKNASSSDNPMTQSKKEDKDGNLIDGIIKTNPRIKEISYISSFSATSGENGLSDRIELSWTYNEDDISSIGLDINKLSVHILKKSSSDTTYQDIFSESTRGVEGTSYSDTDVECDTSYSYILLPYYDDEKSGYNGCQSAESDKIAYGSILDSVENITASINESASSINVEWDKVENAEGYAVYSRVKGESGWTENIRIENPDETSASLSTGFIPGTRYEITVSTIDRRGSAKPSDKNRAEGEILGAVKDVKATGESDIRKDSILLTWSEVENATAYIVSVYDDEGESVFTETLPSKKGTSYTLEAGSAAITEYSTTHSYALSRKYYFTVTPLVGQTTPLVEAEKVSGWWVMPPKNVRATKAEYRDLVIISWDSVPSAAGYKIYRRPYGESGEWTLMAYSNELAASFSFKGTETVSLYEYSISTVMGSLESRIQNYFEDDTTWSGYKKNVGTPLVNPTNVYGTICSSNTVKVTFTVPAFVESFKIQSNGTEAQIFSIFSSTTKREGEAGWSSYKDGIFTCYVTKPLIELNPELEISVKSYNGNAPLETNNTSFGYSLDIVPTPDSINSYEIVNLANSVLKSAMAEVNTAFHNDWWLALDKQQSYQTQQIKALSCRGLKSTPDDTASITLTEYYGSSTQISVSGEIGVYPDTGYNDLAGYLGDDPPLYITSSPGGNKTITITLPYTLGTATVTYNNVYVDGSKGSYSVTYNGRTETVDPEQVSVLPY